MFTKPATSLLLATLATSVLGSVAPAMTMDERWLARRALNVGMGTRYGADCTEEDCWQKGACAFTDYTLPASVDGSTCVSEDIWNDGYQCGGCISVSYKGKTITVMVTNKTGGDKNHLDMTPDTWDKLTGNAPGSGPGGVDGIEWQFVKCPIATPLTIHMHGGASQYWPAATVEGASRRTKSLEFSGDSGKTWVKTTRDINNFFVAPGTLPSSTAWVRVTSHVGTTVVVKDVTLASGKITKATKNYA
ncbi:hypothetical protein LTR56_014255 [Elasticomyces elasticus]|nr:hypothetical protein LTR22_022465 [Elasticomyces elasticus]KAK3636299.1 hypothetical protein LTR56_014255 [Elasticomyces elasticus]KAK4893396.1 hypothetical protein LTR27_008292 [Elasticomyces elasticus]KAK4930538.1 hypothetical protein LTR49_002950 [Elasticomyces elasticus]KAK5756875.1 hypothetical protein LTS12_013076 [Elasticomyces elasticus]